MTKENRLVWPRLLGHSIGAIAKAIGRPKSTVSRELSRNKLPSGRYSPLHAAGAYQLRRRREALIERDRALRNPRHADEVRFRP
jgi:IS30 family transposase